MQAEVKKWGATSKVLSTSYHVFNAFAQGSSPTYVILTEMQKALTRMCEDEDAANA
jgi:hypothetical protein